MMRMHEVEVDDDVFALVKKHAEPLVDDFNSALRRLLRIQGGEGRDLSTSDVEAGPNNGHHPIPIVPRGAPKALRQILEVILLVRGGAYARTDATRFVAKQHRVAVQTVNDKYGRQLGMTADQFDRLLEREDVGELTKALISKFPSYEKTIKDALT